MSTILNLPQTEQSPQPASIHIQDIQNLLIIIDLAAQRGAFKGPELSQIGTLFDRLNKFLQTVAPPSSTETAPNTSPMPKPVQSTTPPFTPKIGG